MDKTLIILRAISGSGKTTYIKNNFPTAFVCSADDALIDENGNYVWAAEKLGKAHFYSMNACKAAMINKLPLIAIDNTNINLSGMKPYIEMAKRYGYNVRIIRLSVPVNVAAERNVHNVPKDIVELQFSRFVNIPEVWNIKEEIVNNE